MQASTELVTSAALALVLLAGCGGSGVDLSATESESNLRATTIEELAREMAWTLSLHFDRSICLRDAVITRVDPEAAAAELARYLEQLPATHVQWLGDGLRSAHIVPFRIAGLSIADPPGEPREATFVYLWLDAGTAAPAFAGQADSSSVLVFEVTGEDPCHCCKQSGYRPTAPGCACVTVCQGCPCPDQYLGGCSACPTEPASPIDVFSHMECPQLAALACQMPLLDVRIGESLLEACGG